MSRRALAAGIAVTLGVAACGGDDGFDAAGVDLTGVQQSDSFDVVATDLAFTPDKVVVAAGTVEVSLVNDGNVIHDLHIEDQPFLLEANRGMRDAGSVELEPGRYVFFCAIPGHRSAGMEGVLEAR